MLFASAVQADGAGLEIYALGGSADLRGKTLEPGLGANPPDALTESQLELVEDGRLFGGGSRFDLLLDRYRLGFDMAL